MFSIVAIFPSRDKVRCGLIQICTKLTNQIFGSLKQFIIGQSLYVLSSKYTGKPIVNVNSSLRLEVIDF